MNKEFAAAQFGSRLCLNLTFFGGSSTFYPGRIDSIRQNILKDGVLSSTGNVYTIGHALIEHGSVEALQFLLKRGFSVEAVDDQRNTLLGTAVLLGKRTFVRLLLEYGANINAICYWLVGKRTANASILDRAILRYHPAVSNEIELMLKRHDSRRRR